ncbi:MAG: hypothetical protein WKF59_20900 [Chitinophagaceae bacterium]
MPIDQILNTASKNAGNERRTSWLPYSFSAGPNGSAGQLGAQHSTAYESMYANIPDLK